MTVYLDVIWLLNLLFDSLLLLLTAIILKRQFSLWRLVVGGFIGSLIILLSITPFHSYSGHTLTKLMFSILMVLVTFGYKRFRYFITSLATLYFVTFLLGGSLIGIHYFLNFDLQVSSALLLSSVKGYGDPISWLFVLLGFPIAWHFSKSRLENLEMTKILFDQLVKVTIDIHGQSFQFTGLIDSGNQLYDPLGRMPVMIVSLYHKQEQFPPSLLELATYGKKLQTGDVEFAEQFASKIRLVPCRVVGQEQQLLVAIKPDRISISKNNEESIAYKVLVSFTLQQLSVDNAYQCIVHPKLLTGTG